ncbi:MAG: Cna B-type domain-containing protein, partial [Clostridia bacterium]|nr:Cna B-type domain-containing protein [Clostridia bacterium]
MKKNAKLMLVLICTLIFMVQGFAVPAAKAQGDVIINELTAESIFADLGDALNYGTVAREWDQAAHSETSACVDVLDRHTNTVFANTDSTYFHAMNYKLEVKVSAPQSLQGMSFALYRFDGEKYVRCEGTEKTVTDNVKSTDLTWEVKEDLKNTRLYVFQTDGDGYVADGQQNGLGLQVNYGASVSASARNDNYIGKIVIHQPMGEGDSMGFFNTFKNSPSLTFGPETRAYYKEFNQETQQYEYIEIIPGVTEKDVGSVLVNYYYTADKDYSAADGDDGLTMGYTKMDGLSYVDGQFVRNGNQVVGVRYMEKGGYADKLLDNAEKFSKEVANLGGGEITSLTPDTTGGSTVTGPVTDDGYVVSLYDAEVGADGIFQVKKDMGWDGIPVAENEYVIINLICPSKDGKVFMGTDSSDITYFYKEGQGRGEGVMWGTADSNSSQRVIFNFVYADENGIMQPFEGTIEPTARHGGTLLAPKANVELIKEVHNGAIIANYVYNGQEIHQRTLAPLGRETWVKMDGGWLTLEKASLGYDWSIPPYGEWVDMSDQVDLSGAVFGVYTDDSCSKDSLVMTLTTDNEGKAKSELLAAGTYWIKEITPLKDHNLETEVTEVTVVSGETVQAIGGGRWEQTGYWQWEGEWIIPEEKFVNQQNNGYASVRIVKHDEFGDELQGAQFGVYTRQLTGYGPQYRPQYTYTLVASATTNRNGVAIIEKVPLRQDEVTYYIREIKAPNGYEVGSEAYIEITLTKEEHRDKIITIDGNGNAEGTAFVNNVIRGNMALKKVDAKTNANLEGAEFTIYSDRKCTQVVGVMTTKRGGDADSRNVIEGKDGLVPGIYYVKETKAPDGYLLPANPTVYTVQVQPDVMVDVVSGDVIDRAPEATAIGNDQAINITGSKVWFDVGFENSRPQEIKVNLYKGKDTNPYISQVVSQQTDWKFSFTNLPRFDKNGDEIEYTIKEDLSGKAYDYYTYINEVDENGNITATIANSIKKTRINGKKVWEDTAQNDPDRPNNITFYLYQQVGDDLVPVKNQDGTQMSAIGGSYNSYQFKFENLPSYDAKGNKAEYVVQEAESDKYVQVDVTTETKTEQGNTYLEFTLINRMVVPLAGTKVWQDSSNADGTRPENVTLVVYRNGERMQPQPTIEWDKETDTDVWQWSISGLPKYDENSNLITYTVKEERVPAGYVGTVSDDGLNFYNTKPGSIRLYKIYVDDNGANQVLNGAEFMLYYDADCNNPVSDEVYVTSHVSNTRNGFIEITGLTPGDYYIREEKAPEGFVLPKPNKPIKVTVVAGEIARVNGDHGVVVNYPDSQSTTVAVTKVWAGDDDKLDARPESITVQLYQNDQPMSGKTLELTAAGNWYGEFTKLPGKDANGTPYTYNVKETAVVPGYLTSVSGSVDAGFTITNTYNYTSISVKKEWKGLATLEGLPEVTVQLKANGQDVPGKTAALSSANNWTAEFDQLLIKDENGIEITYTVEETTELSDFNVTYSGDKNNGFVVTNTVAGGYITLKKVDGDNNNGLSGAEFTIYSDKDCQNEVSKMTTGSGGVATSEILKPGTYYVKETKAPQNYQIGLKDAVEVTVVRDQTVTAKGDAANGDFTNLKRVLVYINKVEAVKNEWGQFDANSAKPLKDAEFTIYSDSNCTQVVTVLVTDENGYAEAALVPGRQYWVKETKAPAGYEIVVTGTKDFWANLGNPMQLTWGSWDQNVNGAMVNVKVETGAITLTKVSENDNKALEGAVFGVYKQDGTLVAEMPATDANGVSTVENIPVGTYYVQEIKAPEGYKKNDTRFDNIQVTANGTAQVNSGNPITNTATTEATIVKVWDDENNLYQRPAGLKVSLSDGRYVVYEITLTEGNGWTATVSDLRKYDADGNLITYTWTEDETGLPEGYTLTNTSVNGTVTTLTNSYEEVEKFGGFKFTKVDETGMPLNGATFKVYADKDKTIEVPNLVDDGKGGFSMIGLPAGNTYYIEETAAPSGYVKDPMLYEVTIEADVNDKLVGDNGQIVNIRIESVEDSFGFKKDIRVYGSEKLNDAFTVKVEALNGAPAVTPDHIDITLNETGLVNGEWKTVFEDDDCFKVTFAEEGTYTYKLYEVAGDKPGATYYSEYYLITFDVKLNENGELNVSKTYNVYTSDNELSGGADAVELTNDYGLKTISVTKEWLDFDNRYQTRPESIQVQLLANGSEQGDPVELNTGNNWYYVWEQLPACDANGEDIVYTIDEMQVLGYEAAQITKVKNTDDFILTNCLTQVDLFIEKIWEDNDNKDDKRPESLTVWLMNGDQVVREVTLGGEEVGWGVVLSVPKYDTKGNVINYTWKEDEENLPEGYAWTDTRVIGEITQLTNSYMTEATVKKVWDDKDDQDGKRPESLTVVLSNGTEVVLNEANSWTATVEDLPKYADGEEIVYTWTEDEEGLPEGYELTGTTKEGTVTTLTNSYTTEVTEATV